jgi:hypothetical protein
MHQPEASCLDLDQNTTNFFWKDFANEKTINTFARTKKGP